MTKYVATQDFTDQYTGRSFKEGQSVRPFAARSSGLADGEPNDRPLEPARFESLLDRGLFKAVDDEPAPKAEPAAAVADEKPAKAK